MKQSEYRAWMEGISEDFLIEAADYKPERRAVPIWYTIGITSAVAAIAVCVGVIAYGKRADLRDPDTVGNTAAITELTNTNKTSETTANSYEITPGHNYFNGEGRIRVLSESKTDSAASVAKDDKYYYFPSDTCKIPIEAVNSPHDSARGIERFSHPYFAENGETLAQFSKLYDSYGYYILKDRSLFQVNDDGTEKLLLSNVTVHSSENDQETDDSGSAKAFMTTFTIEKVFHVNEYTLYVQAYEYGTYKTENDYTYRTGFFVDLNNDTAKQIFPVIDDDSWSEFFYSDTAAVQATKVYDRDAVLFVLGSNAVVVDTNLNYYKVEKKDGYTNGFEGHFYTAKGDKIYCEYDGTDGVCYDYLTGEWKTVLNSMDSKRIASIDNAMVSDTGSRVWFFGTDGKFYTMNYDFSDMQLVTDKYTPEFATLFGATDDTAFFAPNTRRNGANDPNAVRVVSVKADIGQFIINEFRNID